MTRLKAFVGHSFSGEDKEVVQAVLDLLDRVQALTPDFSWEHAEWAQPEELKTKVLELLEDKNLFIGICTGKEGVAPISSIRPCLLNKRMVKVESAQISRKTSDWVLQEIGLAVGRGMPIVILLEEGVRAPGALQGNLEHILFDRASVEKAYPKVMEMIVSLLPAVKVTIEREDTEPDASPEKPEKTSISDESLVPQDDWKKGDFDLGIYFALVRSDQEAFDNINQTFLDAALSDSEVAQQEWAAWIQYARILTGKDAKLGELKKLAVAHPDNEQVQLYLARAYDFYGQDERAAQIFTAVADNTDNPATRLSAYGSAAQAIAEIDDNDSAKRVVAEMKNLAPKVEGGEAELIGTLSTIAKKTKNYETYFHLMERFLQLHPSDHSARFNLAYRYSQSKKIEMALWHYSQIPPGDRSPIAWNNIGAAFQDLELNEKSILAYQKSAEENETLAMSNLAYRLLNAGFLQEAKDLCDKALSMEDYHKNVSLALARINEIPSEEDDEKEKILEKAKPKIRFLQKFGQAYLKQDLQEHESTWTGPDCALDITIVGQTFSATGKYERPQNALTMAVGVEKTVMDEINVSYNGTVSGHTAVCDLSRKRSGSGSKLRGLLSSQDTAKCFLIMNDACNKISVCENPYQSDSKFYEMELVGE